MSSEDSPPKKAADEKFSISLRGQLVFFTLSILTLMAALDGTSLSVALPTISKDLNGTAIEAFWSGTSFLLCSTVFQPSFASLSNIFGRRPIILISILFFCVGAIIAAIAKNFTYMLVGRSIQGVGGGGVLALTEIVITDLVPLRFRGKYFGIMSAMWSLGSVTGPILGGGFAQSVTWRWIFYINFPFIGVGTVFVVAFLNLKVLPGSLLEKIRQIDYIGTVLFVGSLSSFLIPLTWGWHILRLGFMAHSRSTHHWRDPIIPPAIFLNRTATVSFIGSTLQGLILWCTLYYLPLYYEAVKGFSPILTGVAIFPETFTVAPSAMVVGILITITGHYRWAIWLGWVVSTVGLGIMCLIKVQTSTYGWILLNVVPGLGLGILFPSLGYAVQASADPENLSIAVAMFSFFRALGQAIGVAIGGVVFQNRMYSNLLKYPALAPLASAYSQDAAGLVQIIKQMADGAEKSNLKEAYTDSLRIVWAVCCAISGVALLFSLLTEAYDLNQDQSTAQGLQDGNDHKDDSESERDVEAAATVEKEIEANAEEQTPKNTPLAW
ncbi:hypothetical protein N7456_013286 [Penicillium angulare]|uniref:Major facilitator superfamily (MFS) profile domain-containing protein n=1 Tax=Penicillium angulare TaxID=116970 RepID=A0A9W9EFU5_9EURO|nr:hypothetical protein N7456_013286 [Penicillium angulare]